MAKNIFTGLAPAIAQVDTITPGGTIEVGDIFIMTLTSLVDGHTESLAVAAAGTTVGSVCDSIVAAWNASTLPLFAAVTATLVGTSPNGTAVRLTSDTAGVPFSLAVSTTEAGGGAADDQTFARAATTASSGPNHYGVAANWSTGAIPVADDDVVLENCSVSILWDLDQSSVNLNTFKKDKSFTGRIGHITKPLRLEFNSTGSKLVELDYHYGGGTPTGSDRCNLHLGNQAITVNVYGSAANSADIQFEPTRLVVNNASAIINITGGTVGIGTSSEGEEGQFSTLNQSGSSTVVNIGSGITAGTINKSAGAMTLTAGATTINHGAGTLTKYGSGNITTLNNNGGTVTVGGTGTVGTIETAEGATTYLETTGTITVNNIAGTVDMTRSNAARTVTTTTIKSKSAVFKYDAGVITHTNALAYSITGPRTITISSA